MVRGVDGLGSVGRDAVPVEMTFISGGQDDKAPRVVRALRMLRLLASDPAYRHMMRLYWWPKRGTFQPFNDTFPDRYPVIFKFVQTELGADRPLDLLSFGCATGEEVFSLRRYFPRARIKGIDVNPGNIATARERLDAAAEPGIAFMCAASTAAEPAVHYDAIFCMAVLRHGSLGRPGVARCDPLLRFEDFARAIADFHRCLKPGGLLIVRHSNFRVCDAPIGARFEAILSVPFRGDNKTPIFGPDNRLMPGIEAPETVFRRSG
jgi:2-polyprenyl-3-methyl-5-hydroxy-6-metoxy-1,4-benzoquinol methylase